MDFNRVRIFLVLAVCVAVVLFKYLLVYVKLEIGFGRSNLVKNVLGLFGRIWLLGSLHDSIAGQLDRVHFVVH